MLMVIEGSTVCFVRGRKYTEQVQVEAVHARINPGTTWMVSEGWSAHLERRDHSDRLQRAGVAIASAQNDRVETNDMSCMAPGAQAPSFDVHLACSLGIELNVFSADWHAQVVKPPAPYK